MPLILNDYMPEPDYIESQDRKSKFWVNPNIPESIIFKFNEIATLETHDPKLLELTNELIFNVIGLDDRNNVEEFKKYYKNLTFAGKLKIQNFISELIKEIFTGGEKEKIKKKD
jgi:hypothetical protein